ncbi:TIGR02677 family protein [Treponema phagedenis]|uniref:TIGR02677 family protein n=1 Tax=Treponema phagedenis TaxID=162 RepID=UPI0011E66083|nr:TIGR02677 family protein [Treponema phagedenis]QEK00222.1 TIGR02677 family protein [Treponema phagedenis]
MGRISKKLEDYKKISEAAYLAAAQNTERYRIILRYFFVQHERMKDYSYPNEILAHVRGISGMEAYTEDELTQDLNQLVAWKNIVPGQEIKNPRTIAEFNKKVYRYQITPYTVEIERMLEHLEESEEFRGSLDKKTFEKLYSALQDFLSQGFDEELAEKWHAIIDLFTEVRQNTSDYLAYLSSERSEEMMKRESFLAYKDRFVVYLSDFIQGSYQMAMKIQDSFEHCNDEDLRRRFLFLAEIPDFVPRYEELAFDPAVKAEELMELWESFRRWFINTGEHSSEYQILQDRTNNMIRKITGSIRRIGERTQQKLSRKKDYLHVAQWFLNAQTMEEAHRISATVFGLTHTQHYLTDGLDTADIYTEIWDMKLHEVITQPKTNRYQERTSITPYVIDREAKQELIRKNQSKQKQLKEAIASYMDDGRLSVFGEKQISSEVRKILLKWISAAFLTEDGMILTEFGYRVKVKIEKEQTTLVLSEDGAMEMPAFEVAILKEGSR